MKEDQIKGYFAFEEKDLLANRSGKLSEKQDKRINNVDQFARRFVLGMFIVLLLSALYTTYSAIMAKNNVNSWAWAIVLVIATLWAFRGVRNKIDNSVQKAEGEVNFIKVEKKAGSANDPSYKRTTVSSYEMRVGSEAFGNTNPALTEHMQGDVYAVYYTKDTRQILSVEYISKGS